MEALLVELLRSLEERLKQHDENRKDVQDKLQEALTKELRDVDVLEEKINGDINKAFDKKEERVSSLVDKLVNREWGGDEELRLLIKQARSLSTERKACIRCKKGRRGGGRNFSSLYELSFSSTKVGKSNNQNNGLSPSEEVDSITAQLQENLSRTQESKISVQDELAKICGKRREEIAGTEKRINSELERPFKQEDERIQGVVKLVKERVSSGSSEGLEDAVRQARLALLRSQRYTLACGSSLKEYSLRVEQEAILEHIAFGERKGTDLTTLFTEKGELSLSFTFFDEDEVSVLAEIGTQFIVEIEMWEKSCEKDTSRTFTKEYTLERDVPVCIRAAFFASTTYCMRMRVKHNDMNTQWSDAVEFTTPAFNTLCVWKECPDYVSWYRRYSVGEENPRIATMVGDYDHNYCTITGNTPLPLNAVTSWSIKVLKSRDNDGNYIYVGVAPSDIDQNEDDNYKKCVWYFNCYSSTLWSGPPHKYRGKTYGPRKKDGQYVHTGDSVGVVMDTAKGELSFALNGVNLGVAYEGIPLDKPLVPCVILKRQGDSVELDTSEVKENVDSSVPVPSNITTKSATWDTITLAWDAVEGASFYQIEVDGSKYWDTSATNTFTKGGLPAETEHSFRVRAVRGSSVSEWCGVVKEKTDKAPIKFMKCTWRECPDYVEKKRKYSLDKENPRIATKVSGYGCCTIIGNTPLPHNTVTSWSIKILKSEKNNGDDIFIGVAPFDINQNEWGNYKKCGWYFHCYDSELCSGPPHSYGGKKYGPRNGRGQYVHTGDSVGVVMDTAKGELSFVLNGVNLGVAYEGIPLDKPLVPCVLLLKEGDSVELDTSEVKENAVDSSVPAPSNITTKSSTWDSIALTWDSVERASFYQIEVDGSKFWDTSATNTFTKRGLLAGTEHSFRVRAVRGSSVSEWSGVVKEKTDKAPTDFSSIAWKECPAYVEKERKYSVDEENPRVVTMVGDYDYGCCTIIGNTPLPPNTVTSWSVKVMKSEKNNGDNIFIGVAPFDINQNEWGNYEKCGWYFHCYYSELCSGPPHSYGGKKYGPRKGNGKYVHTGDSVGVVMDTAKGELSFVLNGVNLGVAYEGIPLDKPLVPCVLLLCEGDSVELTI